MPIAPLGLKQPTSNLARSSEFLLNSSSESSGSLSDDSDDWEWATSDDVSNNTWSTFCIVVCGNYAVTRYLPILICCLTFHTGSCHDHISRLWVNAFGTYCLCSCLLDWILNVVMERTLNSKLFYLVILNTTCGKLWAVILRNIAATV